MSRKFFKRDALASLARRLGARGHEVVVPEVVVWEWASHAHEVLVEVETVLDGAAKNVDRLLTALPSIRVPPVSELIDAIETALNEIENLTVGYSDGVHAVDAIREQVTQTGVGTKTDGTKTGAADSLILHQVESLLGSYDEVVLATGDKTLGNAAEEIGAVVVRDQRDLWAWFGLTQPPTTQLVDAVTEFIEDLVEGARAEGSSFPLTSEGVQLNGEVFEHAGFRRTDVRQTDVTIETLNQLWLSDIEVVAGEEVPRVIVATANASVVAVIVNWFIGGPTGELLDESSTEDLLIEVPVSAELDENWQPLALEVDGAAEAWLPAE